MASIDKIYGTHEQAVEFYHWCSNNHKGATKYFYSWPAEWMEDGGEHPITNFPPDIDLWMERNCPISWVVERIKSQYGKGV